MRRMKTEPQLVNWGEFSLDQDKFILEKPLEEGLYMIFIEFHYNDPTNLENAICFINIDNKFNINQSTSFLDNDADKTHNLQYYVPDKELWWHSNDGSPIDCIIKIYTIE